MAHDDDYWFYASDYDSDFYTKANQFFQTLTPKDPGYWSERILHHRCPARSEVIEKLEKSTWQEALYLGIERYTNAVKLLKYCPDMFSTGNSRYDQYEFDTMDLTYAAEKIFISKYADKLKALCPSDSTVTVCPITVIYEKDLGYGHKVSTSVNINMSLRLVKNNNFKFSGCVKAAYDATFMKGDLDGIIREMNEELQTFNKDPKLLANLKQYFGKIDLGSCTPDVFRGIMAEFDRGLTRTPYHLPHIFNDIYQEAREYAPKDILDITLIQDDKKPDVIIYNSGPLAGKQYSGKDMSHILNDGCDMFYILCENIKWAIAKKYNESRKQQKLELLPQWEKQSYKLHEYV